ncbi:MAG: hypothetical protein K9N47_11565 [Prosthecobacter sp.]|uniref:hypothetical protein n=1 Tax=Prosthecobacter sp. TaxID=1965333 RepID=UPI0025F48B71|nr:hypothetical protein [Prosthecobacter sp.]MCF7786752.1 hypothetical protein [Prosthecobacter sp.]
MKTSAASNAMNTSHTDSAIAHESSPLLEVNSAGDVIFAGVQNSSELVKASAEPVRLWKRRAFIPGAFACTVTSLLGWRMAVIYDLERRQREAFQKFQGNVRYSLEGATAEDLAGMKQHRASLVRGLQPFYAAALAAVPQASGDLGSFSDCFHIIVRQALDMIKGTSSAQEFITGRLGQVAVASTQMQSLALSELSTLSHKVSGRINKLAADWLQGAEQLPAGAPGGNVMQPVAQMIGSVDGHFRELKNAIGFGALDVALAATLNHKLLLPVLRGYAERAASAVGANIALAVSDGPLPFGEIVGLLIDIGVGLWTAWDIFWLSRELPGKVAHSLREGLASVYEQALAQYDQQAARILAEAVKARQKAVASLLALNPSQLTTPHS